MFVLFSIGIITIASFAFWLYKNPLDITPIKIIPINVIFGKVLPKIDDPLWSIPVITHPQNVNFARWPSDNLDKYELSVYYNDFDGGHLGFRDYSYQIRGSNKREQRQIDKYCKAIINNMRAKQQKLLDQQYQSALDKWPVQ